MSVSYNLSFKQMEDYECLQGSSPEDHERLHKGDEEDQDREIKCVSETKDSLCLIEF